DYATKAAATLPDEIAGLNRRIAAATGVEAARLNREKREKERLLRLIAEALPKFTDQAYAKLPQRERNLHEKAFCANTGDRAYRQLATLRYRDGEIQREL